MKQEKPAADVILRELLKELIKENQDPEKLIPVEEVRPGDNVAYLYQPHNVHMVIPVGIHFMRVNEISKSPVIGVDNLYYVVTDMFAGFETDFVTGVVHRRKPICDNLTVINTNIGEIVRASEDQIKTAYDAVNTLRR